MKDKLLLPSSPPALQFPFLGAAAAASFSWALLPMLAYGTQLSVPWFSTWRGDLFVISVYSVAFLFLFFSGCGIFMV